jgi:hypothetical protein
MARERLLGGWQLPRPVHPAPGRPLPNALS